MPLPESTQTIGAPPFGNGENLSQPRDSHHKFPIAFDSKLGISKEIRLGTIDRKKTNIRFRCRPLRLCFGSPMAKIDRIPDAWPALMTDVVAAAYLDMSVSQFRALVESGRLPKGRKIWETEMVRWRRSALDAAINLEFGLPAGRISELSVATDEDEWDKAIRNAA